MRRLNIASRQSTVAALWVTNRVTLYKYKGGIAIWGPPKKEGEQNSSLYKKTTRGYLPDGAISIAALLFRWFPY